MADPNTNSSDLNKIFDKLSGPAKDAWISVIKGMDVSGSKALNKSDGKISGDTEAGKRASLLLNSSHSGEMVGELEEERLKDLRINRAGDKPISRPLPKLQKENNKKKINTKKEDEWLEKEGEKEDKWQNAIEKEEKALAPLREQQSRIISSKTASEMDHDSYEFSSYAAGLEGKDVNKSIKDMGTKQIKVIVEAQ